MGTDPIRDRVTPHLELTDMSVPDTEKLRSDDARGVPVPPDAIVGS
jgi:hypothetical protein